jgi:hypothetical protein
MFNILHSILSNTIQYKTPEQHKKKNFTIVISEVQTQRFTEHIDDDSLQIPFLSDECGISLGNVITDALTNDR